MKNAVFPLIVPAFNHFTVVNAHHIFNLNLYSFSFYPLVFVMLFCILSLSVLYPGIPLSFSFDEQSGPNSEVSQCKVYYSNLN